MNRRAASSPFLLATALLNLPDIAVTEANGSTAAEGARLCVKYARKAFERSLEFIDEEMDRLGAARAAEEQDPSRYKAIVDNLRQLEKATFSLLDAEARLDRYSPEESDAALDLEGARAEILGRLARLAERGGAGEFS